jgi:hypothetical protein
MDRPSWRKSDGCTQRLVVPRAGNPDTWAENDGRSPTIAFTELLTKSIGCFDGTR